LGFGGIRIISNNIKSTIEYWKKRASEGPSDQLEFWTGLIAKHKQYLGLADKELDNSIFITQQVLH